MAGVIGGAATGIVVGGIVGAIIGGINRNDDGPTGWQPRETGESVRRALIFAAVPTILGAIGGGAKHGAGGAIAGAILGGFGSLATAAAYQGAKNIID